MAQVVYSEEALADFERIIEFLLGISTESATRAVADIRSAIGILEFHPLIGRRIDEQLRELIISRGARGYLALYRFDPTLEIVLILRLRHQSEAGYRD